jgi:uncharacterized phiE125 gp8 family phage protein
MSDWLLNVVTAPTFEPITTIEAKAHLRVEIPDDDALIYGLIQSARQVCESKLKRAICSTTFDWHIDDWPWFPLSVPMPPLQSVTSIKYYGTQNTQSTISSESYHVLAGSPGRIDFVETFSLPTTYARPDAVTVRFVAGYGSPTAVPASIKSAIKLLVGTWYEHRESVVLGQTPNIVPMTVDALLGAEAWGTYR